MAPQERPAPLWQPGEPLTFSTQNGTERTMVPERAKWIGGGNFGEVFSVRGMLQHNDGHPEQARVAIKQFCCRSDVERAVKNHDLLARLTLPVFEMYEAEKEKDLILMPNGNTNRTLTVSQNESLAHSALERSLLWQIENADRLIADIIQTVRKATLFGVFVPFDAYFFFVQRKGYNGIVRHSLDDTDNVRTQKEALVSDKELLRQNICAADQSLSHFFLFAVRGLMADKLIGDLRASLMKAGGAIEEEQRKVQEC